MNLASHWSPVTKFFKGLSLRSSGPSYASIGRLFIPELITALVVYSLLHFVEANFIGALKSTSKMAALGVVDRITHFTIKVAEGFSVGTLVLCGQYNGLGMLEDVGKTVNNAFWATVFFGLFVTVTLYTGAHWILYYQNLSPKLIALAIPFLRIRALTIFFNFVYFALIGFLRSIKNTTAPMIFFIIGAIVFIFFDYSLIFGAFGLPRLELKGAAYASLFQAITMTCAVIIYLFGSKLHIKYNINLLFALDKKTISQLIYLSWPVILDKATIALAIIGIGACLGPLGKHALASYKVLKDLERFALLPSLALAQVTTLLVSNQYSVHQWTGIQNTIKKTLFLALAGSGLIMVLFSLAPTLAIQFFDKKDVYTEFSVQAFKIIRFLIPCDVFLLILSAGLRGATEVKIVMWARIIISLLFLMPIAYFASQLPFTDPLYQFVVVYGSYYLSNGLISLLYIYRLHGKQWEHSSITPNL